MKEGIDDNYVVFKQRMYSGGNWKPGEKFISTQFKGFFDGPEGFMHSQFHQDNHSNNYFLVQIVDGVSSSNRLMSSLTHILGILRPEERHDVLQPQQV
jgi:hypothetical protein